MEIDDMVYLDEIDEYVTKEEYLKYLGTFLQENTFRARNHVQGRYCDPFGGPGVFPGGHCRHSWSQVIIIFKKQLVTIIPPSILQYLIQIGNSCQIAVHSSPAQ